MKQPRNEREFNAIAQPREHVGIKFAGAMRPAPLRKSKRLTLWQRFINRFNLNIKWVP